MYLKYKNYQGRLLHYEVIDCDKVSIILEGSDGVQISFNCLESELSIPNVMGNSKILYELEKIIRMEMKVVK